MAAQEVSGTANEDLGNCRDDGKYTCQDVSEVNAAAGEADGDAGHSHDANTDDLANGHGEQVHSGQFVLVVRFSCHELSLI